MRVALSLSRGSIALFVFTAAIALAGAFAAGLFVGWKTLEPMVVEKVVAAPAPAPAAAKDPEPAVAPPAPPVGEPPPPPPKLAVTIGPPADPAAFGVQIGAYPNVVEAESSLEAHRAALAKLPIFIVPAEIRGKGIWHRVRLGSYKTRAEAETARAALPQELAKNAMVVSYK
jgi:cell division septation protein DedD